MSVAELKRAVDVLSVEDRLELAAYLRRTSKQNDPQWQAEIGHRLDACLQGKGPRLTNFSRYTTGFQAKAGNVSLPIQR